MPDKKNINNEMNLIWVDLEMTGLDTQNDHIIEIATIITNNELDVIAEGPVLVIHQSKEIMDGMDEWNTKHHGSSGLTDRVLQTETTAEQAEKRTLEFLKKYVEQNKSPMCGSSICQDRRFLARQMSTLENFFHYRNLDVSSVKILAQVWASNDIKNFRKQPKHRA